MDREIEWRFTNEPATRDDVARIERGFGIRFPEDYIECALKNHGGTPSYDVFDVKGRHILGFNRLLSLDSSDGDYIPVVYRDIRDRLVDHVYPFASDDFGNFICFDYRKNKENPTTCFWDHEVAFLDKVKGVFHICDSFTELLAKLRPYEG